MPENQIHEAFGPHLVLGGFGCVRPEVVNDPELVRQFLVDIPHRIGMTPVSPVIVHPTDDGVSGFVIIAESHIVVHTKSRGAMVMLDIFSCKDFDSGLATEIFCQRFGPFEKTEFQLFERGLEFPRNVDVVSKFVMDERQSISPG
jgi:S-adenosylmethionine decarboxylase